MRRAILSVSMLWAMIASGSASAGCNPCICGFGGGIPPPPPPECGTVTPPPPPGTGSGGRPIGAPQPAPSTGSGRPIG
jgi:hypothetical protein